LHQEKPEKDKSIRGYISKATRKVGIKMNGGVIEISMTDKSDIQKKILSVIENCLQILRGVKELRYFTEEDTKVKLVLPFVKIFGWDPLNPQDVEMEASFSDPEIGKTSVVDCVLWTGGKRHIFLEIKSLNRRLPNPKYDQKAELMLRYATHKENNVPYVIFTNFLGMDIYDPRSGTRIDNYPDPSCYLTRLNDLFRILAKPQRKPKEVSFTRDFDKCFGTFDWSRPKCQTCNYLQAIQVMCRALANLRQLSESP